MEDSLKTLALIEPGQKISISYGKLKLINPKKTLSYNVLRWLSGDCKLVSIIYIKSIIEETISLNIPIDSIIIGALENLKCTYHQCEQTNVTLTKLQDLIRSTYLLS